MSQSMPPGATFPFFDYSGTAANGFPGFPMGNPGFPALNPYQVAIFQQQQMQKNAATVAAMQRHGEMEPQQRSATLAFTSGFSAQANKASTMSSFDALIADRGTSPQMRASASKTYTVDKGKKGAVTSAQPPSNLYREIDSSDDEEDESTDDKEREKPYVGKCVSKFFRLLNETWCATVTEYNPGHGTYVIEWEPDETQGEKIKYEEVNRADLDSDTYNFITLQGRAEIRERRIADRKAKRKIKPSEKAKGSK